MKDAAGVVTTWAHVHYVVTELGIAYMEKIGRTSQKTHQNCYPTHREGLPKTAYKRFKQNYSK